MAAQEDKFSKIIDFTFYILFTYLRGCSGSWSAWDLRSSLHYVGTSSPTRNQTRASALGSADS